MSGLRKNIYRISWAVLFGQTAFLISLIVADHLFQEHEGFAFVAGALLTVAMGLLAGWIFANRSLTWRRFHLFCSVAGGCLTQVLVSQAVLHHQKSEALSGTGFLAGLGDAIAAAWCLFLSVSTLCLFIAGTATTLNGWRFSLRTLLIGMTCVAATLGAIFVLSR